MIARSRTAAGGGALAYLLVLLAFVTAGWRVPPAPAASASAAFPTSASVSAAAHVLEAPAEPEIAASDRSPVTGSADSRLRLGGRSHTVFPTAGAAAFFTVPALGVGSLHRIDSTLRRRQMSAGVLLPYRGTAPPRV